MALFGKRKKIEEWDLEIVSGVHVGRPHESAKSCKAIWTCLPKGVFVFLVVFGALGGFLSAFDITYYEGVIGVAFFLTAMYFSGLFAFRKSWHKDLGYITYFVFYVMAIYTYRSYVNSGFAVILNEVRQQGEVYFGLNAGNEFSESMEDREMAATMTILFIGMFLIILLNIFISNYMSLKFTAFVTLPIFVFPMYFQEEPQMGYALCLLGGLMGIYVFKNSGHFLFGASRKGYEREKKSSLPTICYTQNSRVYRGVIVGMVACMLVVGAASVLFDAQDFRRYYKENEYKQATRDGISAFLMMGFRLFYPGGYSWSGMSGGDLNDITAVRPDDSTHLVVRFAPYSKETVYLKGFTGGEYANGRWLEELNVYGNSDMPGQTAAKQLQKLYQAGAEYSAEARMDVMKERADSNYEYIPYQSITLEQQHTYLYGEMGHRGYGTEATYTFYPNIAYRASVKDVTHAEHWWVAEECQTAVRKFIQEAGIKAGDSDIAEKVVAYFAEEYSYSYTPGRVPSNQDPINYFLEKNKKGVCVHFASAATLIFRELGIPARYVEGYAIDYNTVLQGTVRKDLNYEDYYDGYSELGETKVMEVEVPGGNAHAWVEIYQEGKGWIIVDPTPSTFEEAPEGGFLDSLKNLWSEPTEADLSQVIPKFSFAFLASNGMKTVVVLLVVLGVLALVVWQIGKQILRYRSWHTKDLRANLLWYYRDMCQRVAKKDSEFAGYSVPAQQLTYLAKRYEKKNKKGDSIDIETTLHIFEQICFSPKEPEQNDYEKVLQVLKKLR